MNREIKFRAWNDNEKEMYYHDWRDEDCQVHDLWQFVVSLPDKSKLLQYTGLKDKNGKEIFEGDILKSWYDRDEPGNESGSGVVRWVSKDEGYDYSGWYWYPAKGGVLEVMGNIYQNPELI